VLLEREQTRSRLEAALQAARAGNGRIVSLEGEAGIGKTSAAPPCRSRRGSARRRHAGGVASCVQRGTPAPAGTLVTGRVNSYDCRII